MTKTIKNGGDVLHPIPWLVYGPAGSGKTWFCRYAAEHFGWERTLWLNAERPIRAFKPLLYTPRTPYGVLDVAGEGVDATRRRLEDVQRAADKGAWLYDLIVFDGLSEHELRNMMTMKDAKPGTDQRQLWGTQLDALLKLVWAFAAGSREPKRTGLGAHVIMTARVREAEDPTSIVPTGTDGSGPLMLRPAVRGQFGANVDYYFDMVLYMEHKRDGHSLYLKPRGRLHIKNNWGHQEDMPDKLTVGPETFGELLALCKD